MIDQWFLTFNAWRTPKIIRPINQQTNLKTMQFIEHNLHGPPHPLHEPLRGPWTPRLRSYVLDGVLLLFGLQ